MTATEIISIILSSIVVPLIIWGLSIAQKSVEKINEIKELDKYIGIAFDAVIKAVKAVSQTYVKKLREAGEWTPEKEKEAFALAKTAAIKEMGSGAYKAISELYGDVNTWFENLIESQMYDNKIEEKKTAAIAAAEVNEND